MNKETYESLKLITYQQLYNTEKILGIHLYVSYIGIISAYLSYVLSRNSYQNSNSNLLIWLK